MALLQVGDLLASPRPKQAEGVEITPSAMARIKSMLATRSDLQGKGLRIYVTDGGCAGYSYGMAFDTPEPQDVTQEVDGLQIAMDPESWPWLRGVRVDFQESLIGSGFSITNPNAAATCGCGTSFSKGDSSAPADTGSCK